MYSTRLFLIRISFFVLFFVLLPGSIRGQTAHDSNLESVDTVLKNVDEVAIDFVVRNKNMATLNLKPEDIVQADDGSVVKLKDLRLRHGTVHVFEYRVERKNDSMSLNDSNGRIYAGYHGLAYIDSSTFGIRRITMEADDLPPDFSIHAASITVDYDYVLVGTHQYLMPVRGTIRVHRGRHEVDLNQVVFQDYRRYASQAKVIVH